MLTQFFKNINWVDVGLLILLVRVVFISVKTGFVTEVFKLLGVLLALFVSLHYYAILAAVLAKKTTLAEQSWQFWIFVSSWAVVTVGFKFFRDAVLLLFKVQTTHEGFDKYGAGVLGALRAILLGSLMIFALLLIRQEYIQQQAMSAWGNKVVGRAAPNTYSFLYHHFIGKLFEQEKFNEDVFAVVSRHGTHPK